MTGLLTVHTSNHESFQNFLSYRFFGSECRFSTSYQSGVITLSSVSDRYTSVGGRIELHGQDIAGGGPVTEIVVYDRSAPDTVAYRITDISADSTPILQMFGRLNFDHSQHNTRFDDRLLGLFTEFEGADSRDYIKASARLEHIELRNGDDYAIVRRSAVNDTLTIDGGAGYDVFYGNLAGVELDLTTGLLKHGRGTITLERFEAFSLGEFNDHVKGSKGDDEIYTGNGDDVLRGGEGNDILAPGRGADIIHGGAGLDILSFRGVYANDPGVRADLVTGVLRADGYRNDQITSIEGFIGGLSDDWLAGDDSTNVLRGDSGDDRLLGRGGKDQLRGGRDDDFLKGGGEGDILYGDEGEDILWGGSGDDVLFGNDESDSLYGDSGNDWLSGGHAGDRLRGGDGNDHLNGGKGHDRLYGNDGNDVLIGQAGRDKLYGGTGDDTLYGGNGARLSGGSGRDTFVFKYDVTPGIDRITDFNAEKDSIQINALLIGVRDIEDLARQTTDGILIQWYSGSGVIIWNTDLDSFDLSTIELI